MKDSLQKVWADCAVKQRIFIGVFLTMFLAGLSIHFLVGRRAFVPLFQEVTERRAETVVLIATTLETAPKPKRKLKKLSAKLGVKLKIVPEQVFWDKYKDRPLLNKTGNQVTKGGYEITTFKRPKSPLFTTIEVRGEPMVLVVKFPVDIEQIKRRRGSDFAIIITIMMVFSAIISHWAFKPIQRATLAMGEIADGNLDHRVTDNIGPAKDAFNHMADRVEQMLEGQRMLLAGISHELRTPLARMRLQSALLENKVDTTSLQEDIVEMDALVEMLLVSSQLQTGSFEIQREAIIVQDLVYEVLATVDFGERYISVDLDSSAVVKADRLLLRRVLINLCTNIAKYTPSDCTVSIEAKRVGNRVELVCADTGNGVSDDSLRELLTPFWQADNSRSETGWGLGLSFVQRAIEAHGGTVELSHNQPTGLRVQVGIPVDDPSVDDTREV